MKLTVTNTTPLAKAIKLGRGTFVTVAGGETQDIEFLVTPDDSVAKTLLEAGFVFVDTPVGAKGKTKAPGKGQAKDDATAATPEAGVGNVAPVAPPIPPLVDPKAPPADPKAPVDPNAPADWQVGLKK